MWSSKCHLVTLKCPAGLSKLEDTPHNKTTWNNSIKETSSSFVSLLWLAEELHLHFCVATVLKFNCHCSDILLLSQAPQPCSVPSETLLHARSGNNLFLSVSTPQQALSSGNQSSSELLRPFHYQNESFKTLPQRRNTKKYMSNAESKMAENMQL